MIKLKRVYESMGNDDGKKFLVERLWPRGVKKTALANAVWLKDVAPSTELRKWFGHDPRKWEKFCQRYWAELADKGQEIGLLREKGREGNLTLVYGSRDEIHNAAAALKLYLEGKTSP